MAPDAAALAAPEPAAILDSLATAILVVDARSRVAWLNQAASDPLATSGAAARGRPLSTLLADGAAIEALLARSRESEEPIALRGFELAPSARADSRYQVDVTLTPLAGEGRGVLVEIADTTGPARMTRDAALLVQQGGSRVMARQLAIRKFLKTLSEQEIKSILASLSEQNRQLLIALYSQYRDIEEQEQARKPEILRS